MPTSVAVNASARRMMKRVNEVSPWVPMSGLYPAPFESRVVLGRHVKLGRKVSVLAICRYNYTGEGEDQSGFPCDPLTPKEALALVFACLRAGLRAITGRSASRLGVR